MDMDPEEAWSTGLAVPTHTSKYMLVVLNSPIA
jgi:hypothetical protein